MNINRHNYEEFFLLYIDNELAGEDRAMVEAFVAANPDLNEELQLLQQIRLLPEGELEPGFLQQLLKPEEITITTEQDFILRSVDEELLPDERRQLVQVLLHNPTLQQELDWLNKTKLQADLNIVFPDKALLYKKEQQPGLVVSFNKFARRFAAAASIVLMLGTGWWLFFREQPVQPDTATNTGTEKSLPPAPGTRTQEATSDVAVTNSNTAAVANTTALQTTTPAGRRQRIAVHAGGNPDVNNSGQNTTVVNPAGQQESLIVQTTTEVPEKISEPTSNIPNSSTVPTVTNTASNVSFASYNNTEETENEYEGFLNEHQQRRSGIKGFFKKAKRTLERRTGISSGESEVRFAVFAIGTK
jgi:hypothetical protein